MSQEDDKLTGDSKESPGGQDARKHPKIFVKLRTNRHRKDTSGGSSVPADEPAQKRKSSGKSDLLNPYEKMMKNYEGEISFESGKVEARDEEKGKEEDSDGSLFLTPDEMLMHTAGEMLNKPEAKGTSSEESGDSLFLTPDEMLMRTAGELLAKSGKEEGKDELPAAAGESVKRREVEELGPGQLITPEEMEGLVPQEDADVPPPPDMADLGGLGMMSGHKLAPVEIHDEEEEEGAPMAQLDTGPITTKGSVLSPDDMLSPDEMEEEEEFVSKALLKGTIINERFKILRLINEKREKNTYVVKDTLTTGKKFILKEVIPRPMSKEEYRDRRNTFNDTIRILNTFKHPNLVKVYDGFQENNRNYYYEENIDGLDLVRLNEMNTKFFSEKEVMKWALQLCDAAEFLHYRPVPFTMGEIGPRHVMVDDTGLVKIIGFDLQRFFDVNRTLAYLPDDPTKLYGDVTEIARIIYFLLTKQEYDSRSFDIEWPDHVKPKMRKLLETACKTGQKTYGDVKVLRKKLEETQLEDKPEVYRKRWGFDFTRLDFTWAVNAYKAVVGQSSYMIAAEILLLVFLLAFSFATRLAQRGYVRPANNPLAYIFTADTLHTYDMETMQEIHQDPLAYRAGDSMTINVKVPDPEDRSKKVEKDLLLVANESGRQIFVYDTKNNKLYSRIHTENAPYKMFLDSNDHIWVLHYSVPLILIIDKKELAPLTIVPMEEQPMDLVVVTGKIQTYIRDKKEKYHRGKLAPFMPEQNQMRGIVISSAIGKGLFAVNPSNLDFVGMQALDFAPSDLAFSKETGLVLMLDRENRQIVPYDVNKKTVLEPVSLPRKEKGVSGLISTGSRGKVWLSFQDTNRLVAYDPETGKFDEAIYSGGLEPYRMIYRPEKNQIWILHRKTKNITILNPKTGEIEKDIKLGKIPVGVSFFE